MNCDLEKKATDRSIDMDHDHHQQTGPYNWSTWAPPAATKRKPEPYESWEERAFAEDAAGVLGSSGCVWPPRSYTCSFCRREFRSAQALGGHMNVHRRDRARLKQLPNTPQPPPPITPFLKPNYKKCPSHNLSTFVYGTSTSPSPSPNPNINPSSMQSLPNYAKNEAKIIEVECRDLEEHTKCANSELSISLNLVVRRNRGDEEDRSFKRRKIVATSTEASPPLILLSKGGEVDHKSEINVGSSKEIDLELRLGR